MEGGGGAWVAQAVKWSTLEFSSGHELTVGGVEPTVGSESVESPWNSLFLSLCSSLAHALAGSLSKINLKKQN